MVRDVAVRVMLKLVTKTAGRAIRLHGLMDATSVPARRAAVVETQLVVRIPICRSDPASQIPRDARNAIAALRRGFLSQLSDFLGEIRGDALVGIERQYPVVRRETRRVVLLRAVAGP